jgi:hypothetical protein
MNDSASNISGLPPGRFCPSSYAYSPGALARDAELHADTLYVAGGLYGNTFALQKLLELVDQEPGGAAIIFNGDFNWFNIDRESFSAINETVRRHAPLRGNVETELANDEDGNGCGCAYPADVGDAEVERSNEILARLRETARAFPDLRSWLRELPMHLTAEVAGVRVAIVHGDAESLAGWAYSEEVLGTRAGIERLRKHFTAVRARVIASSHTCLPVAVRLDTKAGACALFNNGAAGMPNFAATQYGIVTRISATPACSALYGTRIDGAHVDAIALHYDRSRWIDSFLENWPQGSRAHESYFRRITEGPAYNVSEAVRGIR